MTMHQKVREIINQLKPYHPEKIILFGSYASGQQKEDSDIDIVVIKNTNLPFLDRQKQVHMLLRTFTPVDVFVFTPEEFKKGKHHNLFLKEAAEMGKVIYG